jgi:hypothetical protein
VRVRIEATGAADANPSPSSPLFQEERRNKTAWNLIIDEHYLRLTSKLLFRLCKPRFPLDIEMITFF